MEYRYHSYGDIRVAWNGDLNGGGFGFGQQYLAAVPKLTGSVDRVHEVCAGPGFIGFSLLARGLCRSLCLSDINPHAVAAVEHTIALNRLHDRVSVYLSDALDGLPHHEQWDLVVGNPPHLEGSQDGEWGLRQYDPDWRFHRRFYASVARYLRPHGRCLLQESFRGSTPETFLPMLEPSGLAYDGSFVLTSGEGTGVPSNGFYFMQVRLAHADLVSVDRPHVVCLVHDGAGVCAIADGQARVPLALPVGAMYVFSSPDLPEPMALEISYTDAQSGTMRSRQVELPSRDTTGRRTAAVAVTAPCRLSELRTGRVIVIFS